MDARGWRASRRSTSLAAAPVADVVRAWAGLGYNRRAVNLQRAAQAIVERHGGRVPDTVEALEALPGVGPYTARAVAAIAFGRRVGAVDTNVRRVLGRVAAGDPSTLPAAELQALADAVVPRRAGRRLDPRADGRRRARLPAADAALRRLPGAAVVPVRGGRPAVRRRRRAGAAQAARSPPSRRPPAGSAGGSSTRARDAADGAWVAFDGPIGVHDRHAVRDAVEALAGEGLLEVREATDGPEARLPA